MPVVSRYLKWTRVCAVIVAIVATWCSAAPSANPDVNRVKTALDHDTQVSNPAFKTGKGPRVQIDEAHRNYHTMSGRFRVTADILASDGFRVSAGRDPFTSQSLGETDIVVIANAAHAGLDFSDITTWTRPGQSAFSTREIEAVRQWVHDGGALFMSIDYMPVAGSMAQMASAFGIFVIDGFAYDADGSNKITYRRDRGTIKEHPITRGIGATSRVDQVTLFAGTALLAPEQADSLLVLDAGAYVLLPHQALDFGPNTPRHTIEGWSQGVALVYGSGRVAIFGESGAFTAQRFDDGTLMGLNHPDAPDNKRLFRNVFHWLAHTL